MSFVIGQLISWGSTAKFPKFLHGLWTFSTCILVNNRKVQFLAGFIGAKILFFGISLDSLLRLRATHHIRAYRGLHSFFADCCLGIEPQWAPSLLGNIMAARSLILGFLREVKVAPYVRASRWFQVSPKRFLPWHFTCCNFAISFRFYGSEDFVLRK